MNLKSVSHYSQRNLVFQISRADSLLCSKYNFILTSDHHLREYDLSKEQMTISLIILKNRYVTVMSAESESIHVWMYSKSSISHHDRERCSLLGSSSRIRCDFQESMDPI